MLISPWFMNTNMQNTVNMLNNEFQYVSIVIARMLMFRH